MNVNDDNGVLVGRVLLPNNLPRNTLAVISSPDNVPDSDIASAVFDITLLDESGNEVQLTEPAEVCFVVDEQYSEDSCLGFIDTSVFPSRWVCEDKCLKKKDDQVCGKTDHFTSFAVLLGSFNADCGANDNIMMFDATWKDSLLIAITAIVVVFTLIVIALLLAYTKPGQRLLLGSEGVRVHQLRTHANHSETYTPEEEI